MRKITRMCVACFVALYITQAQKPFDTAAADEAAKWM